MKKSNWHIISKVVPIDNRIVILEFADNTIYDFDLKPLIKKGNVFECLLDDSNFYNVKIGNAGRTLDFPNEIDFCADALWLKAHPEKSFPFS